MKCPYCSSEQISKYGFRGQKQRYQCNDCNRLFVESPETKFITKSLLTPLERALVPIKLKEKQLLQYLSEFGDTKTMEKYGINVDELNNIKEKTRFNTTKRAKVLLFDVETMPMQVLVWGLYKQRIPHDNVIDDYVIISWSAKWLFSSDVMSGCLTPEEAINKDDKRIMTDLWSLFDDSDVIIAHNGVQFDIRKCNARFILNGIKPPSPYKTIDTLTVARKYFAFSSNRLDYLGKIIENKGKIHTDFELWKRCMAGEQEALDYMVAYNKEDVVLLEDCYLFLRPYIKSHPNIGLYAEANEACCGNCGSYDITWGKSYHTSVSTFNAYRCNECGAIGRGRKSVLTIKQRDNLTVPISY
jgi:hypothetical protein